MKTNTAMFLVITGLVLTMGAVGGVESSLDNQSLISAVLLSIVGLSIMTAGVAALRVSDYYDNN